MAKNKHVPVFWGCNIANRLPFLEKTTRLVLGALGYEVVVPDGLTCCPDPVYGKGMDEDQRLALAARNLAICKDAGDDLMVACNGCYDTFTQASGQLKDRGRRASVNQYLDHMGLTYNSSPRLLHILSFFDKIGTETLEKAMPYRLSGLRLGVHYGCHIMNTGSSAIEDPCEPKLFERILSSTGLEAIPYAERHLCCGGSIVDFDPDGSLAILREKFRSAKDQRLDALVLCCPLCFIQFDTLAKKLEKDEVLPVFFFTELLALALGIPEKDINFDWHATKLKDLLDNKLQKTTHKTQEGRLDMSRLRACCGACTYKCSAAKGFQDNDLLRFDPVGIVQRVVAGHMEEVLRDPEIWRCLKCHECSRHCPFGDGLAPFFETLQQMAMLKGVSAKPFEQKMDLIRRTGMGMPRNPALRKDFGLPEAGPHDRKVLEIIFQKDVDHP